MAVFNLVNVLLGFSGVGLVLIIIILMSIVLALLLRFPFFLREGGEEPEGRAREGTLFVVGGDDQGPLDFPDGDGSLVSGEGIFDVLDFLDLLCDGVFLVAFFEYLGELATTDFGEPVLLGVGGGGHLLPPEGLLLVEIVGLEACAGEPVLADLLELAELVELVGVLEVEDAVLEG